MTKAKITDPKGFDCAPRGSVIEHFPQGAVVEGKVAEWALAAKKANRMFDPVQEKKVETAPETKAKAKAKPRTKKGAK